jgi:hypothetical protein
MHRRTMLAYVMLGALVLLLVASPAALSAPRRLSEPSSTLPAMVLETVFDPVDLRVIPRQTSGLYPYPVPKAVELRLRVQAPQRLVVSLPGGRVLGPSEYNWQVVEKLPGGKPGSPESPEWYFVKMRVYPIPRGLGRDFPLMIRNESLDGSATSPTLAVGIDVPPYRQNPRRPSRVFNSGDNSKGFWAERAIAAWDVTLAGWLVPEPPDHPEGPHRNNGCEGKPCKPGQSEDWHYNIWLDTDFIQRNYIIRRGLGDIIAAHPLRDAVLQGNGDEILWGWVSRRLLSRGQLPSAAALNIPGAAERKGFTVELNAWHKKDRGNTKPRGWVHDPEWDGNPDSLYFDNAWPFDPRGPKGAPFQAPQYVIMTGTLWQDSDHHGNDPNNYRRCVDQWYPNHGGWLELHPIDIIERVPAPSLRKHAAVVTACAPSPNASLNPARLSPTDVGITPPTPYSHLRFTATEDARFSMRQGLRSYQVGIDPCDPTKLRVYTKMAYGVYSVTYTMWWEERPYPRRRQSRCTPR